MLNSILIIYSVLFIAALAKFYGYYNIRGKKLIYSLFTPLFLLIIVPSVIISIVITKNEIPFDRKIKMACWCLYDSVFNYPENVGVLAVSMNMYTSQAKAMQCAKKDNTKILVDDIKSVAAFRLIPRFYCDIHSRRLLFR